MVNLTEALAIAQRHMQAGRWKAAERVCRQILAQQPTQPDALMMMQQLLAKRQQQQDTIAQLRQQLQLQPTNPQLHNQLGVLLKQQGDWEGAIAHYQQAIAHDPAYADALNNLGNVLRLQGRLEEAITCYRGAIAHRPHYPEAYTNLGLALHELGQIEQAIEVLEHAIEQDPNLVEAHFTLSLCWLTQGDFERGFVAYEWRWRRPSLPPRSFTQPLWDGQPLNGKTLLLHAEQGLGDTLQFIRYAPLIAQQLVENRFEQENRDDGQTNKAQCSVIVECQASLLRLLATLPGIHCVARDQPLPGFDCHAPLLSLPRILGTTVETIPAAIPYLRAPISRRQLLPHSALLNVGLVWAGNPHNQLDRLRSAPLAAFEPLFGLPNSAFYSLQKGDRAAEWEQCCPQALNRDLGAQLHDFADTAAVIEHLDLVITVDTAVAHLAGAMGKPVWVLLAASADWRWLQHRDDSPWYPTMRLFRQTQLGNWAELMQRVGEALWQWAGAVWMQQRHYAAAIQLYQQWLEKPETALSDAANQTQRAELCENLGIALSETGQFELAIAHYQQALQLMPEVARTYYNLGNAYRLNHRLVDAIAAYDRAIELRPTYADAFHNRGVSLHQLGQWNEARTAYEQALQLKPDYPEALNSLGVLLRVQGDVPQSIDCFRRALHLRANYPEALNNLGLSLTEHAQFKAAADCYATALRLKPGYAEAMFNSSLLQLLLGDLAQGFRDYEWRWQRKDLTQRQIPASYWDGSRLDGKTILLHAEQGLGDTLQFIRYGLLVAQRGGRIVLECQSPLVRLLQAFPGIDQVIARGDGQPTVDCHIPLMSLPHVFGTTLASVPAPIPYITAAPELAPLPVPPEADTHLKVGIVWAGNPNNQNDRNRSAALATFLPLLELPDSVFYSLQKGDAVAERDRYPNLPLICLDHQLNDFADTAAAIAQLDLVITVDTAVAHLAGAMGKPVWVLLCYVPDWRWLWNRDNSPWYPTARLFRQPAPGDWGSAIAQVLDALQQYPRPSRSSVPLGAERLALARQQLKVGRVEDARHHCYQAVQHNPNDWAVLNLLGRLAHQSKDWTTAIAYFQWSVIVHGTQPEIFNEMGNLMQRQQRFADALPCYRQALQLQPEYGQAYNNLGAALQELGCYDESIDAYHRAIELQPGYADAYYNLGNTYRSMERLHEAIAAYHRAIALQPNYALAYNNAGLAYYDLGQPDRAVDHYQQAIALQPDYADAHLNLSLALLCVGELATGFAEYEWRWQAVGSGQRPKPAHLPLWDGSDLTGKTILLQAEQGLGDTLQFVRYVPLVADRGGQVVLQCQPPLLRLLSGLQGVTQLISSDDSVPAVDAFVHLLDLPHRLGTTLDTIPAPVAYLSPPEPTSELRVDRSTPSSANSVHIGLVWAGNPTHKADHQRSCPFHYLEPLLQQSGITFHCLQIGTRAADLVPYQDRDAVVDWSDRLHDLADTAAVIAQLDLVITVDTAVAHLSGALGKPVWVMLAYAPDWRWMRDHTDSPWYPTARLFRQPTPGDWATVICEVLGALQPDLAGLRSRSLASASRLAYSPMPAPTPIGIGFPVGIDTGWGVYGLNLALQLLRLPHLEPAPLLPIDLDALNPLQRSRLAPTLTHQRQLQTLLDQHPNRAITGNLLVLRPLGNHFVTPDEIRRINGTPTVGVIFSEDTCFTTRELNQVKPLARLIAGSSWNAAVLKSYGIESVMTVQQGIDPALFHPAPRSGLFSDRFVIFSGGKLEFRKGQDIVVAAFKAFQARHPDALLLVAWHNPWVETMAGLARSPHLTGLPQVKGNRLAIQRWLTENGIAADALLDVGFVPHPVTAQVMREADVAVFPNRAEGGTNLVAMECLACGIPTILAANTGHLDLIDETCLYPLRVQRPVTPDAFYQGTEGWGESDVEELVETLEHVYSHREEAQDRGRAAAEMMHNWRWELQVQRLVEAIADLM